ncbi:hypothetical protein HGA13_21785 [Nocardia speluncae]|uniref:Uncharacterized protein n=1 Tax=Nocardia speluncae TaxID=419477 RepID=A0A846XMB1_9NOCA|nr:hypothetical protein [Nocardia speluncae]NKY35683.1 hypothetical protein [Nocardia speluncae]
MPPLTSIVAVPTGAPVGFGVSVDLDVSTDSVVVAGVDGSAEVRAVPESAHPVSTAAVTAAPAKRAVHL